MKLDSDGSLTLTYDVSVTCHGKIIFHLGTGYGAVARFVQIADAGIPEAKEIEELWANNYKVKFMGTGLAAFISKHYPERTAEISEIDPQEEYVLDCYDMS